MAKIASAFIVTGEGTYKICSRCNGPLEISRFSVRNSKVNGIEDACKDCINAGDKLKRPKHKSTINTRRNVFNRTIEGKFNNAKRQANTRNLSWLIEFEEYKKLIEPNKCHYCSNELPIVGIGLDRIDSSKDYLIDNVVACCKKCNLIKGEDNISHSEMKIIMNALQVYRFSGKWPDLSGLSL